MRLKYIVLCRYGSTRLPGKILKQIDGIPVLAILLKRLNQSINPEDIIVATSDNPTDDPIELYCKQNGIHVFRGSLENVAERFLICAETYNADYAVRVNGDNVFTDSALVRQLALTAVEEKIQFVSNVPKRTFPTGISVEVLDIKFYRSVFPLINLQDKYKEHVTLALYENPSWVKSWLFIENKELEIASGTHLALDTPADFQSTENIIRYLGEDFIAASWKKIIETKKYLYE